LKIEAGKLVGTRTHPISLEKNSIGEPTRVDEKNSTDRILDSRLDGNKLVLKIADNGDEQTIMECAFWLITRNRGELEVVAPDDDKWKPWKLVRTSPAPSGAAKAPVDQIDRRQLPLRARSEEAGRRLVAQLET
jgi:hypothetical protein